MMVKDKQEAASFAYAAMQLRKLLVSNKDEISAMIDKIASATDNEPNGIVVMALITVLEGRIQESNPLIQSAIRNVVLTALGPVPGEDQEIVDLTSTDEDQA